MDIMRAFRLVRVRPEDRHLLGFQSDGKIAIVVVLPFSFRASPFFFCMLSSSDRWIVGNYKCDDAV